MGRLRFLLLILSTNACLTGVGLSSASAALIGTDATMQSTMVDGGINGGINYVYDAATQRGVLTMTNVPYNLSSGVPRVDAPIGFYTNGMPGMSTTQTLTVVLDQNGQLVDDVRNSYFLYGSVSIDGTTYAGPLLTARPTAFGSQDLGAVGIEGMDLFDVNLTPDGGLLQGFFGGPSLNLPVYLHMTTEWDSTFTGRFDQDFSSGPPTTFLASGMTTLVAVPEPSSLLALVTGSLLVLARRIRRTRTIERAREGAR